MRCQSFSVRLPNLRKVAEAGGGAAFVSIANGVCDGDMDFLSRPGG